MVTSDFFDGSVVGCSLSLGGELGYVWERDGVIVRRNWWTSEDMGRADRCVERRRNDPFLDTLSVYLRGFFGADLRRVAKGDPIVFPGVVGSSLWRQDLTHLIVGVCLGDCTVESNCLEWVPGSHRWGKWVYPQKDVGSESREQEMDLAVRRVVGGLGEERGRSPVVRFEGTRGDMVLLHPCVFRRDGESINGVERERPLLVVKYFVKSGGE